jgi:hypothetical protein
MKKVSLLVVLVFTWAALAVLDVPAALAYGAADRDGPPQEQVLSEPVGGDTVDGDPDDIIEGNRRNGDGTSNENDRFCPHRNAAAPGIDLWDDVARFVRLLIAIQH